ncbi:AraC family transcriptional regulator [Variovorax sp. J22G73]|uniref:AraC family transcriptional regulator n=1 Tax=unclassified Variovorax TaxID=663243 RepID=UPI0025756789|nr:MULTISPECIES: AraC family transcriptional regulator [unclassified Variovorax]MDM0008736.1 AraC family transcriptional regulator [Variovorax sp. J22R203]MDM0101428.1 AraC family transcriptional regulator [Variovorax sp. J22G73]
MDPLSELVGWLAPRGRMDLRCLFGQDWAAPHAPIGPWRAPFHIVLRGRCELWLPASRTLVPLEEGNLVILPRGSAHVLRSVGRDAELHAGEVQEGQPAVRLRRGALVDLKTNLRQPAKADTDILCGEFEFPGQRRSALREALPEPLVVPFAGRPESPWLEALVRLMAHEIEQQRPGAQAIVAELSGTLFTLAVRAHLETRPALAGVLGLMASPRLAAGLEAMLAHPGQAWTVASLAERCHMSRATFAREFARRTGTAPLALLTTLRMELASRMLAQGGQDTASVGEAVGYRSEAAFNRAFTRHAGVTPGRFRRASSNAASTAGAAAPAQES